MSISPTSYAIVSLLSSFRSLPPGALGMILFEFWRIVDIRLKSTHGRLSSVSWSFILWFSLPSFPTEMYPKGARMKKFFTVNGGTGVTNEFTTNLENKCQTEVKLPDECDYILAFCLINTRPGIDIQETKEKCPGLELIHQSQTWSIHVVIQIKHHYVHIFQHCSDNHLHCHRSAFNKLIKLPSFFSFINSNINVF